MHRGNLHEKKDALVEIMDPITEGYNFMEGQEYVDTMSAEAINLYADGFAYLAKYGSFRAFNSKNWGSKLPPKLDPK